MEEFIKLYSALKSNERAIAISVVANSILAYLILFGNFKDFKSYEWYEEILLSLAVSISYTVFFGLMLPVCSTLISVFVPGYKKRYRLPSAMIWYLTIVLLSFSIMNEIQLKVYGYIPFVLMENSYSIFPLFVLTVWTMSLIMLLKLWYRIYKVKPRLNRLRHRN